MNQAEHNFALLIAKLLLVCCTLNGIHRMPHKQHRLKNGTKANIDAGTKTLITKTIDISRDVRHQPFIDLC